MRCSPDGTDLHGVCDWQYALQLSSPGMERCGVGHRVRCCSHALHSHQRSQGQPIHWQVGCGGRGTPASLLVTQLQHEVMVAPKLAVLNSRRSNLLGSPVTHILITCVQIEGMCTQSCTAALKFHMYRQVSPFAIMVNSRM